MKLRTSLSNWDNVIVDVTTDEEIGDINLAIKYDDHGDSFLYVRTYSGEKYEYGYWLNRNKSGFDFDPDKNQGESDNYFIKRPILFKHPDDEYELSNKIYRLINSEYIGIKSRMDSGPQIYTDAERRINRLLLEIGILMETPRFNNIMYNFTTYKKDIERFIFMNELDHEYLDRVNRMSWTSRINGFDGIAGKRVAGNTIVCDEITSILYKGKNMNINELRYSREKKDEWGFSRRIYHTKQFA